MVDRYHSSITLVFTSGAARTFTHGLVVNGVATAPDEVMANVEHGASIGASSIRVTNKGTAVCSLVLDQENNPAGAPNAATVRVDALVWHSIEGTG